MVLGGAVIFFSQYKWLFDMYQNFMIKRGSVNNIWIYIKGCTQMPDLQLLQPKQIFSKQHAAYDFSLWRQIFGQLGLLLHTICSVWQSDWYIGTSATGPKSKAISNKLGGQSVSH